MKCSLLVLFEAQSQPCQVNSIINSTFVNDAAACLPACLPVGTLFSSKSAGYQIVNVSVLSYILRLVKIVMSV